MIDLPPARVPFGDAYLGALVARHQWPDSPCNGHEQITVSAAQPADPEGAPAGAGKWYVGIAYLAEQRCRVWIRADLGRALTCRAVVHELGHLAGHGHEEGGIMAPDLTAVDYAPCRVPR